MQIHTHRYTHRERERERGKSDTTTYLIKSKMKRNETMLLQRGSWDRIKSDERDVVVLLLRIAGHGNLLDRNINLALSSKVKVDVDGYVVELILGKKEPFNRAQRRPRQPRPPQPRDVNDNGNNNNNNNNSDDNDDNDDLIPYWDLSSSIEKFKKLQKLGLCHCRSLPLSLCNLPNLQCLELHLCHGSLMVPQQQHDDPQYLSSLVTMEIHGGIWTAQSMEDWMKWMTTTTTTTETTTIATAATTNINSEVDDDCNQECSKKMKNNRQAPQLQEIRYSFLNNDVLDVILDFLSPSKNNGISGDDNGTTKTSTVHHHSLLPPHNTSTLKIFAWKHSGMTNRGLERLILSVVPWYPNLYSIDVSGNQIRTLQFLLDDFNDDDKYNEKHSAVRTTTTRDDRAEQPKEEKLQEEHTVVEKLQRVSSKKTGVNNNNSTTSHRHHHHYTTIDHYHSLRILNLQHNPILKHRTNHPREKEAFELLLIRYFPIMGSLTPSWEDWDPPIEYLLRINRGGRVLVEHHRPLILFNNNNNNNKSRSTTTTNTTDSNTKSATDSNTIDTFATTSTHTVEKQEKEIKTTEGLKKKTNTSSIPPSLWSLVLERAYSTSSKGFLPCRKDATAIYYLIRHGNALSEIYAGASS
jgi:hypothetical protein